MRVDAVWVKAGIEFTCRDLHMGEVTVRSCAVSAITTERHLGATGELVEELD